MSNEVVYVFVRSDHGSWAGDENRDFFLDEENRASLCGSRLYVCVCNVYVFVLVGLTTLTCRLKICKPQLNTNESN